MKKRISHIPIIPLGLDKESTSINKELIVDYDTNNVYLFNDEGDLPDDLVTTIQKRLQRDKRHEIISPDQKRIYGVDIDFDESEPTFATKYVEDSIGFKNLYVHQETGDVDYGSWKNLIKDFFGIEPVLMENGVEVLKIDPEDYDRILDNPITDELIYGFEIDLNKGTVSYIGKAKGNVPVTVTDTGYDYGSWKRFLIDFVGVKPTAIKDAMEAYDIDPNHYDVKISQDYIEDDNIMIRFIHNYYKINFTHDKFTFMIANYQPDETYVDDIFIDENPFYIGAYEGIRSKSGLIIDPIAMEDLNNLLLGKRYLYIFCIGVMISKSLELESLGYHKYNHYDNNKPYNDDIGIFDRVTGINDQIGFFNAEEHTVKTFGAENLFGNGGQNNVGVYADGGKLIATIDEEREVNSFGRCIHIENRLLDYRCKRDSNINLAFSIDEEIIQISMPARLII